MATRSSFGQMLRLPVTMQTTPLKSHMASDVLNGNPVVRFDGSDLLTKPKISKILKITQSFRSPDTQVHLLEVDLSQPKSATGFSAFGMEEQASSTPMVG